MAIALDTNSARSAGAWVNMGGASSLTWSHTCSGSDRLLVVLVPIYGTGGTYTVSGVTYNGVSMTSVATITATLESNTQHFQMFGLIAPATGANNIVITFNAAITGFANGYAISFTGVHQTTPLGTAATAQNLTASTSSPTCTVTVGASTSWLVGGAYSRAASISAGSGTTLRNAAEGNGSGDSNGTVATGTRGLAYTSASATWPGVIVAELQEANSGATQNLAGSAATPGSGTTAPAISVGL